MLITMLCHGVARRGSSRMLCLFPVRDENIVVPDLTNLRYLNRAPED
jgi:hypothetical protein